MDANVMAANRRTDTVRGMMRWVMIAVLVAGCGSKSDEPGKDKKQPAAAGSGSAETKINEADLFTGTTVALPTPAAKLKLAMTEAEAKTAAPELFAQKYGYEVPGTKVNYTATKIYVQIEKGKVWNIRAELTESQDQAKAWLEKKWGPAAEHKNSIGTPQYFWAAPAAGLRAKLEQQASKSGLYFSRIIPRDQLLGSDPKHLGFETTPLVGASKDDALKSLADYTQTPRDNDPDAILVSFPPTETGYEDVGSYLELRVKGGKVTGYTFSFVAGDAKDVDALVSRLEAIYGKGKPDGTGLYTDYGKNVKAEIRKDIGFPSTLWVGDYKK
jgi:hypothetical protein